LHKQTYFGPCHTELDINYFIKNDIVSLRNIKCD
jgi:hypothetical protein